MEGELMNGALMLGGIVASISLVFILLKSTFDRIKGKYDEAAQVHRDYHQEYRAALERQHQAMAEIQRRMREMGSSANDTAEAMRDMGRAMGAVSLGTTGSGGDVIIRAGRGGDAGGVGSGRGGSGSPPGTLTEEQLHNHMEQRRRNMEAALARKNAKKESPPEPEGRSRAEILRERSLED
jgi:uncharacterized protein YukE